MVQQTIVCKSICMSDQDLLTFTFITKALFHRYNLVFMFLTYFLPIGSMSYTYARVGLELWGSQSIGECTQRQLDNIKSKRKVCQI